MFFWTSPFTILSANFSLLINYQYFYKTEKAQNNYVPKDVGIGESELR